MSSWKEKLKCLSNWRTNTVICQDYTMRPTNCGCIFILLQEVVFLCVVVTKGAQFDQYDWPRTLGSQVSNYDRDYYFYLYWYCSSQKFFPKCIVFCGWFLKKSLKNIFSYFFQHYLFHRALISVVHTISPSFLSYLKKLMSQCCKWILYFISKF